MLKFAIKHAYDIKFVKNTCAVQQIGGTATKECAIRTLDYRME